MRTTPVTKRLDSKGSQARRFGKSLAVGLGLTTLLLTAPAGLAQETGGIGASGRVDTQATEPTSPTEVLTGIGASGIVAAPEAPAMGIGAAGIVTADTAPATLPASTSRDAAAASMQAMPDTGVGTAAETSTLLAALAALGAVGAAAVALRERQTGSRQAR